MNKNTYKIKSFWIMQIVFTNYHLWICKYAFYQWNNENITHNIDTFRTHIEMNEHTNKDVSFNFFFPHIKKHLKKSAFDCVISIEHFFQIWTLNHDLIFTCITHYHYKYWIHTIITQFTYLNSIYKNYIIVHYLSHIHI